MDATAKIGTVIMFCDESVLGIQFENGYSVVKTYLADFPYKDRIVDGRGQLDISYLCSVMSSRMHLEFSVPMSMYMMLNGI